MCEKNLGKTLSELRAAKGVTQDELAAALSVSNKTVSKWENNDSLPDVYALAEIAEYYGIGTDSLLGLKKESQSTSDIIAGEFRGLDNKGKAEKLFEIMKATFPAYMSGAGCDSEEDSTLPPSKILERCSISSREKFTYLIDSDEVRFAVAELPNHSNYSWLLDSEAQEKIGKFLTFLADPDTMKILYFINSSGCSRSFTADYISKKTSVDPEKIEKLLKTWCEIDFCKVTSAHMKSGTKEIYESNGDSLILSVLSIAYERTRERGCYEYFCGGDNKLIRGNKI